MGRLEHARKIVVKSSQNKMKEKAGREVEGIPGFLEHTKGMFLCFYIAQYPVH